MVDIMTYLNSGSVDSDSTGGVLARGDAIDDDDIWTAMLLECKSESDAGWTGTDDEDLSGTRQRHRKDGS